MEEFKCDVSFTFCQLQRLTRLLPRAVKRAYTKHIGAIPAERVPVTGGETQVVFHALTQHQLIRIVVTKR